MTRLPSMTSSDVIKKLKKLGFVFDRYSKGSHEICYIKESGYSVEDFVRL